MTRSLLLNCLVVLWIFSQPSHANATDVTLSAGDEVIQIEVTGSGATPESAREDATRRAVLQAVGSFIRSDTTVEDGALVRDRVISHAQGLIERYEPLAPASKQNGVFEERARVTVRRTKLAALLTDLAKADGTIDGVTLAARLDELRRQRASGAELVALLFENWPANVLSISIGALPTECRLPPRADIGHDIVVGNDEVYLEAMVDLRVDPAKWKVWSASARQVFEGIAVAEVDTRWNAERNAERLRPGDPSGDSGMFAQKWGERLSTEAGAGSFLKIERWLNDEEAKSLVGAIENAKLPNASNKSKPTFGKARGSDPITSSVLVGISEVAGGRSAYYLIPCSALSRVHGRAPLTFPPLLDASLVSKDGKAIPARLENVTRIWNIPHFMAAQGNFGYMWASPALVFSGGVWGTGGERIPLRALCFIPRLQVQLDRGHGLADVISVPAGFIVNRRQIEDLGKLTVEAGRRCSLKDWEPDAGFPAFDSRGPSFDLQDCR
ncbi:MAG: hypothetical protein RIT24_2160 [Planctomycetota bacterium]